jgi:IS5 family transposase
MQQVLTQQSKDKNKIYSLHEPNVYVIAKGKDHKQYEYGNKVSIVLRAFLGKMMFAPSTIFAPT